MNKNYNYLRRRLMIPEYGRHIQEMIDSLFEIEDREERTRQAKAVIAVMGNLNPLLRDTAEFTHKLWDHLFIMSDFRLDVESPYPLPTRDDLEVKPERLEYPQSDISHKHYGKNITRVINRLKYDKPEAVEAEMGDVVRYLHGKSMEYNQEHPTPDMIANDIRILSEGGINLDGEWIKKVEMGHKSASAHQKNGKHQQRNSRQAQKGGRKNGQRHNTQK
ncbi:MAG: DUF4290 domain-containing protein [Alistipes sp.]|nr:DUF4290 domain-containing protein [Alistipes sp.]